MGPGLNGYESLTMRRNWNRLKTLIAIAITAASIAQPVVAQDTWVGFTGITVDPDPRGDESLAIDGNTGTSSWSYLTAGYPGPVQNAYLDLGESYGVIGLRLYKHLANTDDDGASYQDQTDLFFAVSTTDIGTPVADRNYQLVTGLTNGYLGTELFSLVGGVDQANAKLSENSNPGWLSVTFDGIDDVTAIRFGFHNTTGWAHYPTREFQAITTDLNAIPEPSTLILLLLGTAGLFACARKRRR